MVLHIEGEQPETDLDVLPGHVVAELLGLGHLVEDVVHQVANELQGEDDAGLGLLLESPVINKVDLGLDGPEAIEN